MYPIPAERVEAFEVVTPAATPTAVPVTTALSFPSGLLVGVEIKFPSAAKGLSGIRLLQSTRQVLPSTAGSYIVGDDELIGWPLDHFHETGRWAAQTYNTDAAQHPIYVRFLLVEVVRRAPPGLPELAMLPL